MIYKANCEKAEDDYSEKLTNVQVITEEELPTERFKELDDHDEFNERYEYLDNGLIKEYENALSRTCFSDDTSIEPEYFEGVEIVGIFMDWENKTAYFGTDVNVDPADLENAYLIGC